MHVTASLARVASLALIWATVAACGGGSSASETCDRDFAAQVNPVGGGNGVEALDQATRDCGTLAAWTAAWIKYPNAHGSAVDAIIFLKGRCLEESLASLPLCVAVQTQ